MRGKGFVRGAYLSVCFKTTNLDEKYDDLSGILGFIMADGDAAGIQLRAGYGLYSGCNVLMLISVSVWERRAVDVCGAEGC